MSRRVIIFLVVLTLIPTLLLLFNTISPFLPSFIVPLVNVGAALLIVGSIMFFLFKD